MSYCININLTFLLIILGYKKFVNTFYRMHYYINTMLMTDLVIGLGRNTEGVIAITITMIII